MKRTTALYAVTAIAALSFASQAFAKGGSMGGGQGHGNTGGTHQMASTMQLVSGNGMQQRSMLRNGSQQGPAVAGPQNMKQSGSGNSVGHENGKKNGNSAEPTPVATTTN